MKNTNILKSFTDLPPPAAPLANASLPVIPNPSAPAGNPTNEDFREKLRLRATVPFIPAVPYRHWGLNE